MRDCNSTWLIDTEMSRIMFLNKMSGGRWWPGFVRWPSDGRALGWRLLSLEHAPRLQGDCSSSRHCALTHLCLYTPDTGGRGQCWVSLPLVTCPSSLDLFSHLFSRAASHVFLRDSFCVAAITNYQKHTHLLLHGSAGQKSNLGLSG